MSSGKTCTLVMDYDRWEGREIEVTKIRVIRWMLDKSWYNSERKKKEKVRIMANIEKAQEIRLNCLGKV